MIYIFKGKRIFLTGGTGSFGNKLLERLQDLNINKIYVYSRDEKKQYDLRQKFANWKALELLIGDVRDIERLRECFPENIDWVIHAAALKHVPQTEVYPIEAVKTNIIGAYNITKVAIEKLAKKVLGLSTDKAVKAINSYGISKAMQEKIFLASNHPCCSLVRYGNIMNSRGSVIPYFINLSKQKQPLKITNLNMTRFMLTLEDSVDLVLFAFKIMKGKEIIVMKPFATSILILAQTIWEIYNTSRFEYELIGTRPGEKIHEELITIEESLVSEELTKPYVRIKPFDRKVNDNFYSYSSDIAPNLTKNQIKDMINKL